MSSYDLCRTLAHGLKSQAKDGYEARCLAAAVDALDRAYDAAMSGKTLKKLGPDGAKINIGAGVNWSKEGWVALDKYAAPGDNVVVCDLLHRDLPRVFRPNSAEAIYSTHTMEHFTFTEAGEILQDCFTILKPGGVIRLVVPDLDIAVEKLHTRDEQWWGTNEIQWYKDVPNLSELDISWNFLKTIGVQMNPKYDQRTLREVIRGFHFSAYNFAIMQSILTNCGFENITKSACNKSSFECFNGMDNREKCSLYVEARKPE